MTLPKVLIIGQPFNNDTGGGITLTNLFTGWDTDKLAVACLSHLLLDNIDTEVCNMYYRLGEKEQKWRFPFNYIQKKYPSGILKFDGNRIQDLTFVKSKLRVKIIMNYFLPIIRFTGLIHFAKKTELSKDLCKWLDEFSPDVIYVQAEDRERISFCLDLHSYLKKPMIFHMMDDWPSLISERGILRKYWDRKIDSELKVLLNRSNAWMSICDEMTTEYKTKYNIDFIPFHNPVDLEIWRPTQRNNYDLTSSPTILYAGRIGLGIDTSLELIAKAIDKVNEDLNLNTRFILQTELKPKWTEKYKCLQHQSFVDYNDLPKIFSGADFLVLPYDFSVESIKYIKFSMPTKASEYMISGTPIIIFAPKETAIVKYAQKNHWAKVITENNWNIIAESIKSMINNKDERRQFAQNAIKVAEKNHNAVEIRRKFKAVICSLSIGS